MDTNDPQRRPPGRPRKHTAGRVNATVRFSPERYQDLKAAADAQGRSVSEEVETRIERLSAYERIMSALTQMDYAPDVTS